MDHRNNLIAAVLSLSLLLCGLLFTTLLLVERGGAEQADRDVLAVMSSEDIAFLAQSSGTAQAQWEALFGDYGSFAFAAGELPVALVENHERTSMHLPDGFDPDRYAGAMVKALYLYDDYADRVLGSDPAEIENLLFRAVTDRGLRLLILRPFYTAEGVLVTDIAVYRACLGGLAERLEARGYTFGETFSCLDVPTQAQRGGRIVAAAALPLWLGCWLLCRVPWVKQRALWLYAAGVAALPVLWLLQKAVGDVVFVLLRLGTALVFPCAGAWGLVACASWCEGQPLRRSLPCVTAALAGLSLLGGGSVAALMSGRQYMMGLAIFTGVKAALLLPMAFGVALLLWSLRRRLLAAGRKTWAGVALVLLAVGGVYLLLTTRSGDAAISHLETALRNWLEESLYARPRSKELLFAVPCIPVYVWAARRKHVPLQLLGGAGACLECVSVVNTFCHAVAPLRVSLLRSLLSLGLGLAPGLLAVAVLEGLWRKTVK